MAYCTIADVKKVLDATLYTYGGHVDDEIEWAETEIDAKLGGHYILKFDDAANYASTPVQIVWIAAHLAAFRLWDQAVSLEGQADDTAAARWRKMAFDMMDKLISGDMTLTLSDGSVVSASGATDSPRFYPEGTRDKASSDANLPWFTRAQATEW